MKSITLYLAILSIFGSLYGSLAVADIGGETYYGFQYVQVDEGELDMEPTVGVFRIGSMGDNGVGVEARFGVGLSDDEISGSDPTLGNISLELEVDTVMGLYLVGQTTTGTTSVYGIIGFTQVDYTISADAGILGSASVSDDESDMSYGFGVNINVSDKVSVNLEFVQILDKDDIDASAVSLGVLF